MITWLRNADVDEAEFFALVVAEAGVTSGMSSAGPDVVRAATLTGSADLTIVAHPASAGFFDRTAAVRVGTEPARDATPWSSPVYRLSGVTDLAAIG